MYMNHNYYKRQNLTKYFINITQKWETYATSSETCILLLNYFFKLCKKSLMKKTTLIWKTKTLTFVTFCHLKMCLPDRETEISWKFSSSIHRQEYKDNMKKL